MIEVEYRVRPVVRYIVTKYVSGSDDGQPIQAGVSTIGEFLGSWHANQVCTALAASEVGAKATLTEHEAVPEIQ